MIYVMGRRLGQQHALAKGFSLPLPTYQIPLELALSVLDGAVVGRCVNQAVDRKVVAEISQYPADCCRDGNFSALPLYLNFNFNNFLLLSNL